MRTFPWNSRSEFLDWCQSHEPLFDENAEELGLSKAQTAAFEAATEKAKLAIIAQHEAEQAARQATLAAQAAIAGLRRDASNLVRLIRARAENSKNPLYFYNLAQILPYAQRGPSAAPPVPGALAATLEAATGSLTLRWKARSAPGARGTHYIVRRRLPGEGGFTFLGTAGTKRFVDDTLPASAEYADYTVQAVRGRRTGALSPIFTVRMGRETPKRRNAETPCTHDAVLKRQNAKTPKSQNEAARLIAAALPVWRSG